MQTSSHPCGEPAGQNGDEIEPVAPSIVRFITRHHVMTLATTREDAPHCCALFYAYDKATNRFVVTSSASTYHVEQLRANSRVAGSIVLETRIVGKVQGVQFRGNMFVPQGEELHRARKLYLGRFPYAAVLELELWVIEPDYLKLTDNRLGFGKKLLWTKEDDNTER